MFIITILVFLTSRLLPTNTVPTNPKSTTKFITTFELTENNKYKNLTRFKSVVISNKEVTN